jgi:hypothetical protein
LEERVVRVTSISQKKTLQEEKNMQKEQIQAETPFEKKGKVRVKMDIKLRDKNNCMEQAEALLSKGTITDMTQRQVAEEIFAHAIVYYRASACKNVPAVGVLATKVMKHGDPVDLISGGDTHFKRMVYRVLWFLARN